MEDTESFYVIWRLAPNGERWHQYVHPTLSSAFDSYPRGIASYCLIAYPHAVDWADYVVRLSDGSYAG